MKNLLIYISPEKKFNAENEVYIKIQILNSFKYWERDDVLLVTNFPYKYLEIESTVVPDDLYSDISCCVIKINTILYLLEKRILNELTWFHDTEAWQVAPLEVKLEKDLGLTDYGWSQKWNGGSMFFKPESKDIFKLWKEKIEELGKDDERTMMELTKNNVMGINSRIQRINIAYNIGKRHVEDNLKKAGLPRVLHFHPFRENLLKKFDHLLPENLKKLMYAHSGK